MSTLLEEPMTPEEPISVWEKEFDEIMRDLFFTILGDMRYLTWEQDTKGVRQVELEKEKLHDNLRDEIKKVIRQLLLSQHTQDMQRVKEAIGEMEDIADGGMIRNRLREELLTKLGLQEEV